jgi:hypothetical protein
MATFCFVEGALTPSDLARREETKRLALSLGHNPRTWKAAGHIYHDYTDAYEATPYVPLMPPPPPLVVAASAPRKLETAPVGSDSLFITGTRADAMLRGWSAPFATGKEPASRPLLVIGQSAWSPVTKYLRSFHAYPKSYDRVSIDELPTSNPELLNAFRCNTAYSRVIMVFMPSIAEASIFAIQRWQKLSADMPMHSFAFFTLSNSDDAPPARVTDTYAVIRWQDAHPTVPESSATMAPQVGGLDPLRVIAASHIRTGGVLRPGRTVEQQLGLVEPTARDLIWFHNQQQAAAVARHTNAVAGHMSKRFKPNDAFDNPGRFLSGQLQGFPADFGHFTKA